MREFYAEGTPCEMNAQFVAWVDRECGRVVNHSGDVGEFDPINAFVVKWGLSSRSEAALRKLPPPMSRELPASFEPSGNTADMDSKFLAWLRSRCQGDQAWNAGTAPSSSTRTTQVGLTSTKSMQTGMGSLQRNSTGAREAANPVMMLAFMEWWGFSQSTRDLLFSSPPEVQQTVLNDFWSPWPSAEVDERCETLVRDSWYELASKNPSDSTLWVAFHDQWGLDSDSLAFLRGLQQNSGSSQFSSGFRYLANGVSM